MSKPLTRLVLRALLIIIQRLPDENTHEWFDSEIKNLETEIADALAGAEGKE